MDQFHRNTLIFKKYCLSLYLNLNMVKNIDGGTNKHSKAIFREDADFYRPGNI